MEKFQGDDIGFSIKVWADNSKTELIALDNISDIIVYIYTDGCNKAMFSKTTKTGYSKLLKVSSTEYSGIIDSGITKLMSPGTLNIEINIIQNETSISDGIWNLIRRGTLGVLRKSLIKIES